MNDVESNLMHMVPVGCKDAGLVLEYIGLLDAFASGTISEFELVTRTKAIAQNPTAVTAFVTAYRSITDTTCDGFRTVHLSGGTPSRAFLEWALMSCGELRGYLLDKPKHLRSHVLLTNHGRQSTCVFVVHDETLGSFLWDSAVFDLDAPVLALAAVAMYCEAFAYDVRPRAQIPDFGAAECLRESNAARRGLFDD